PPPQGSSLGSGLCCPGPSSLNRPHPPHSRARPDFTAWRLIRDAFAVRERLGDPRAVPVLHGLNEGQKIAYDIVADKRTGRILGGKLKAGLKLPVTYHVVVVFDWDEEGELKPGEAQEVMSPIVAERRARSLALEHAGALAFSRTGNPATGEFQDAVILARFGDVDLNSLGE